MTHPDIEALRALLTRVETARGPDRELDALIIVAAGAATEVNPRSPTFVRMLDENGELDNTYSRSTKVTSSLDAAVALVERVLPGFYQSSGLCALSGHASIGPDYNGPNGDRLRAEWPEDRFHDGFHADLKPGDGRHRQCYALIHCALQALIAHAEAGEQT